MSMHSIRLALVSTVLGLSTAAPERRARKARASGMNAAAAAFMPGPIVGGGGEAANEVQARHPAPSSRGGKTMVAEPA